MAKESLETLEQFLKLQKSLHGPKSAEVAKVLVRMAVAHTSKRNYPRAESLFCEAINIEQEQPKPSQTMIRELKQQIQEIQKLHKDLQEEEQEWLTVSTNRIPAFTPQYNALNPTSSPSSATTSSSSVSTPATTAPSSASAPHKSGVSEKVIADAKLHIHKLQQVSGHDTTAVADAMTKLADLYCKRDQLDEMEPLLIEALRIRENICGEKHLSVSTDLKNLGRLYYFKQAYDKAEALLKRAKAIRENALGANHSYVAEVAEWQAKVLRKTNRNEEATEVEEFVNQCRSQNGSDWDKLKEMGTKAMNDGRILEAQAMWRAALDECSDFRFDDPRLSTTLESLAEIYWRRGKYDKAEPLCKQILQLAETVLGAEHADVGLAANNLAILCERQGKNSEAAILYQQALSIAERYLGHNHEDVVNLRESHARARQEAQKQVEHKLESNHANGRWTKSGWWKAYQ